MAALAALAAEELGVADPTYGGLLRTTMAEIGGTSATGIEVVGTETARQISWEGDEICFHAVACAYSAGAGAG